MLSYKHLAASVRKFLSTSYEKENAGEKIFENLKNIMHFYNACIFYTGSDSLTPVYSYNYSPKNTAVDKIEDLKENILKETLFVNKCPFGLIVISDQTPYSEDERDIFKTCAAVISEIIKDIELADIMKMQVKAFQDGIVEINEFNKIIKEQNKKIINADKIKNKFLSNVSHELRSPLNSIIGFSDLLLSQAAGQLNEKQTEYIKDIQIAGIHLSGMVNEILDISKIESHALKLIPKVFELETCLNEVLNILKPLYMKKEILIKSEINPETTVFADYQKLQQIFFNIISNAIKFTPANGKIKIYTKTGIKYITISIEDTGIGIEQKNLKRIFKKFEQIPNDKSENPNSTGLGLTITKELVKLHHGQISVESEINKGSIFHIKLPLFTKQLS